MDDRRQHRHRVSATGAVALVLSLVATVTMVVGVAVSSPSADAQQAVCPPAGATRPVGFRDPTGSTIGDASTYFRQRGLGIRVVGPSGSLPADAVVAAWGVVDNFDDVITQDAVLCAGTRVPPLGDLTVGRARSTLEAARLVAADGGVDPAFVVVGQRPSAGTVVRYGTAVTVDAQRAAAAVAVVPELLGLAAADARSTVTAAGLVLELRPGGGVAGVVGDQDPVAGSRVAPGTTVTAFVGALAVATSSPDPVVVAVGVGLIVGALVVVVGLARAGLRRRARRRARSRLRTMANVGAVRWTEAPGVPGPPTRVVHIEAHPDAGVRRLEEPVP